METKDLKKNIHTILQTGRTQDSNDKVKTNLTSPMIFVTQIIFGSATTS